VKLTDLLSTISKVSESLGATPYICGGTPRDLVMKKRDNVVDIDITTGDTKIHQVSDNCFKEFKKYFNVDLKISNDGHRSIYFSNVKVDFSSNFNVPNIDSFLKQKGIDNPTNLERECFSRDFTCNSLLMSTNFQKTYDPTRSGLKDISSKTIRCNLDPKVTLTCNKNRAIRALYLAVKLDFQLDKSLKDYLIANPEIMHYSSPNALEEKIDFMFDKNPNRAQALLTELDLWSHIPITRKARPYYTLDMRGLP
jgi:tRNA nucleotidyltransferase/poly(A) polymerase